MCALTFRVIIFYTLINHHSHRKHGRASGDDGPAVAAEAAAPQNLGEPGECGSAADFFSGCLISGCVGFRAMGDGPAVAAEAAALQIGLRAMGDETAVAAEAAASQNLGEPGECGSAADFFSGCLISGCGGTWGVRKQCLFFSRHVKYGEKSCVFLTIFSCHSCLRLSPS